MIAMTSLNVSFWGRICPRSEWNSIWRLVEWKATRTEMSFRFSANFEISKDFEIFGTKQNSALVQNKLDIIIKIAPNSRARKGGRWRGSIEEFEGRRKKRMLTTGNGATQSVTCCTMCKTGWVVNGHERFENGGNVLGRHPVLFSLECRGYIGGRRSPTP